MLSLRIGPSWDLGIYLLGGNHGGGGQGEA